VNAYRQRFDIEEMFRDFKSSSYNLEEIQVTSDRLMGLLVLMTIAYSMTTFQGKTMDFSLVSRSIEALLQNIDLITLRGHQDLDAFGLTQDI
jgi:hypothetical protein